MEWGDKVSNNVQYFRKKFGITQKDIGEIINKSARTVCAKENSLIPWTQLEIKLVTDFFKTKDENINIEIIFFTELYSKME